MARTSIIPGTRTWIVKSGRYYFQGKGSDGAPDWTTKRHEAQRFGDHPYGREAARAVARLHPMSRVIAVSFFTKTRCRDGQ